MTPAYATVLELYCTSLCNLDSSLILAHSYFIAKRCHTTLVQTSTKLGSNWNRLGEICGFWIFQAHPQILMQIHTQILGNSPVVKYSLQEKKVTWPRCCTPLWKRGLLDNANCGEESPEHFSFTVLLNPHLNLVQLFQQQRDYVKRAYSPRTKCSWTALLLFNLYSCYIRFSIRSAWMSLGGYTGGRHKCQTSWATGGENHRNVILAAN